MIFIDLKMDTSSQSIETTLKYRIVKYDKYDTKYASVLKTCFNFHNLFTQEKFNELTDNLMNDAQISRNKLLDAIDDYNISIYAKQYPLNSSFTDNAWNYRPYQS